MKTKVKLDGEEVEEIEFHMAGEDGEFMWIRFKLANGKTHDTMYFKGTF